MNPSDPLQDILVAPAQMTVGSLDEFRVEVIAAVARTSAETTPHLSVDLRGTQVIDATGLGVLLLLHKRAREKSLKVRLLGPAPSVLEVLRNTRVHLLFEIIAPGEVAQLLRSAGASPSPASVAAPPSLDEVDPHPSVTYPGLSNPFEPASMQPAVSVRPNASRATTADAGETGASPVDATPSSVSEPESESELEPVALLDPVATPHDDGLSVLQESRCPDCGRTLPSDREVQFCPWCGTGDRSPAVAPATASAPAAPQVASVSKRASRSSRLLAAHAVTPSAVTPSHPAIFSRREPMTQHTDDFRALLDATQLYHRIDEDGDARIIFPLESGRTQTAWITRNVDAIGEYAFRYVMSFVADAGEVAGNFALMSSLLEQVSAKKGGGLVTRGSMLLYRMPVSTQASPESLAGAVALAAGIADELETAITGEA